MLVDASSSSLMSRPKKRWTREQLLRNLKILGNLDAPLPPTLPPSPPASRSTSPAPGAKRKSDSSDDSDHVKRPRTSDRPPHTAHYPHQQPHRHHHQQPTLPLTARVVSAAPLYPARTEPAEDGEVREELPVASSSSSSRPSALPLGSSLAPSELPIRRPRKGKVALRHHDTLHDHYHNAGRMLKYSGDARFWSTYPPSHREFRPLADPPPPGSPYHKHGGLIARLELVDALVCFAYSIWNRDYGRRSCNRETWKTIEAFLGWCKAKWQAEDAINDAEKAFLGLIWMIEAFIHGRKMQYAVRGHLDHSMDVVMRNTMDKMLVAANDAQKKEDDPGLLSVSSLLAAKSKATPTMLPSPASIVTANSANSTPTNRDDGTPNTTSGRSDSASAPHPARPGFSPPGAALFPVPMLPKPYRDVPVQDSVMQAMADVTEPIGPTLVWNLKDITGAIHSVGYCMLSSQSSLNLPIMARHFPTTFARMMHTSLGPTEEHEPDFEDEEGELFWPGQLMTGEGLGWVCLMGKAMIKEFGKAYGYKGLDGVVPKPKPEEQMEDGSVPPQQQQQQPHPLPQRPGSTPQGHHSGSTPQGHHGRPPHGYGPPPSQQAPLAGSLSVPPR